MATCARPRVVGLQIFLLLLTRVYGQVIKFQESRYTFPESRRVCVTVENMGGPVQTAFAFSYSFDAVLIGQQSHREIRGTEYFKVGQTTVSVCLPPSSRDNRVCEDDTIGTIRLINSSTIRMVEPHVATVTMTDDEFLFASFSQTSYTFPEDSGTQQLSLDISNNLAKTITFHLTTKPPLEMQSTSISLVSSQLSYQPGTQVAAISVLFRGDQLGLEEPDTVSLGIVLSSAQCYDLIISPTTVVITDSTVVVLEFSNRDVRVHENEGEAIVCVTISTRIARPLQFVIIHSSSTSENTKRGGGIFGQFPAYSNITKTCVTIPIEADEIIERNERISLTLDVDEQNYPNGVFLRNPSATITIIDTSQCKTVIIKNSTNVFYEVPPVSSICFQCHFKEEGIKAGQVTWRIDAHHLKPGIGDVLSNGTLQVTNSSSVFKRDRKIIVSCSRSAGKEEYTFPVALKGAQFSSSMGNTPSKSSAYSSAPPLSSFHLIPIASLIYTLSAHYFSTA